jgi:hypothetical protein
MSAFWTIFWIAIFIIPAFWLASIVLQFLFMGVVVVISGLIELVKYIFKSERE